MGAREPTRMISALTGLESMPIEMLARTGGDIHDGCSVVDSTDSTLDEYGINYFIPWNQLASMCDDCWPLIEIE